MNKNVIKLAVEQAELSTHKYKIGAVVFKGKRIFGSGYNEVRTCSRMPAKYRKHKFSLHAEQKAVLNSHDNLDDAEILVVRLSKTGKLLLAKPCIHCCYTLEHVKIKYVYYSNDDGEIIRSKVSDLIDEYENEPVCPRY